MWNQSLQQSHKLYRLFFFYSAEEKKRTTMQHVDSNSHLQNTMTGELTLTDQTRQQLSCRRNRVIKWEVFETFVAPLSVREELQMIPQHNCDRVPPNFNLTRALIRAPQPSEKSALKSRRTEEGEVQTEAGNIKWH